MHTAQDGDKKLAELWDKHMVPAFYKPFKNHSNKYALRYFAAALVDDKFQALKAERDAAVKELAALKSAKTRDTPDTQPEPAETEDEDERMGREMYEEWCSVAGCEVQWKHRMEKSLWIALAKRRPKVVPPSPKLREPGQVLCDALRDYLCPWRDRNDKHSLNAIAVALGIEAQP